ncbi:VOC family protein [Niabella insulamsoli]|uniref:VOC family protein n=1 Tax=Niabella insulamsoli TaxID=3144874 RepID=UPI0031FCBF6E
MATTNTYLTFNGDCEAAFDFYKSVFGGDFAYMGRFGEMPEGEAHQVSDLEKNKIMHVSLPIGKSILMGSDCGTDWAPNFIQGNNFSVSITADSQDEADKIFSALSEGGRITMPLNKTFWGDYFGMLTDKFGVNWMMSYNEQRQ